MKVYLTEIFAAGLEDIRLSFELCENGHTQKESFAVSVDFYTLLNAKKGECSPLLYDRVEEEASIYAAYKKGASSLMFASCSKKRLVSKLCMQGFDKAICGIAVSRLEEKGYIDDRATAKREAEKCVSKLWGERRIRSHLISKQFDRNAVDEAMLCLEDSGVNFFESCSRLLEQKRAKKPKNPQEAQKLIASLCRYGYSSSMAKEAISQLKS